jgi:hypothetical protein
LKATIVFEKNWKAISQKTANGDFVYRYIVNRGSSRSSKTVSLCQIYDLYARENISQRLTVWRDTKTDCKKTVMNDFIKMLKRENLYKVNQEYNKTESIFTYSTDSTVEIHGTDDEETVMGLNQDVAWFNEPYKISRDTFDQIDQRTSNFVFIDYNPKKDHWVEDLIKDPRTLVIDSTFRDNPFCPKEQRAKILSYQPVSESFIVKSGALQNEDAKKYDLVGNPLNFEQKHITELSRCRLNEDKNSANLFNYQVYALGTKAERPNRILHWTEIPDSKYFEINTPIYYGVDWGKVDPWGIVELKYYDGAIYLNELNYDSENKILDKLTDTERAQIAGNEEGIVKWMFDKLQIPKNADIICDNNRKEKIRALWNAGYDNAMAATKTTVVEGVNTLSSLKVYYTSSSKNIAYEQENYSRQVDRYGIVLEEPEDTNNHIIDPCRYIVNFLRRENIIKTI